MSALRCEAGPGTSPSQGPHPSRAVVLAATSGLVIFVLDSRLHPAVDSSWAPDFNSHHLKR